MRADLSAAALALLLLLFAAPLTAQEAPQAPADQPNAATEAPAEEQASKRVTGIEALEALVRGRTHYRSRSDGSFEVEYHSKEGISAYVWEGCVIRGEWWATEEEICFFYPDNDLQGPHCFHIEKGEKGLEFWWSGNPLATEPTATTVRDVKGNSEHLPLGVNGECLIS